MALSSQAQWFGLHLHPVFYLVGDQQLQQQLQREGVLGVPEAAAAAERLLAAAAAAGTGSAAAAASGGGGGMAEDLEAIRGMVVSKEQIDMQRHARLLQQQQQQAAQQQYQHAAQDQQEQQQEQRREGARQGLMMELQGASSPAAGDGDCNVEAAGGLWRGLCPTADTFFDAAPSDAARTAYARTVMQERDVLLTKALWELGLSGGQGQDTAAAVAGGLTGSSSSSCNGPGEARHGCVVAVVGANHVSGIVREWGQLTVSLASPSQRWQPPAQQQQQQHVIGAGVDQVSADATAVGHGAAIGLEFGVVGGLGWAAMHYISKHRQQQGWGPDVRMSGKVSRNPLYTGTSTRWPWYPTGEAPGGGFRAANAGGVVTRASSSSWSSSSRRLPRGWQQVFRRLKPLAVVAVPVAVAAWPLHQELQRMDAAVGLLQRVAEVNDVMLAEGRWTDSTRGIKTLVAAATAAAAAGGGGGTPAVVY